MGTATLTPFITDLESVLVVKEPLNLESMLQYFELIFAAAFFLRDNSIRIHQNVLFNDNFQLYSVKLKSVLRYIFCQVEEKHRIRMNNNEYIHYSVLKNAVIFQDNKVKYFCIYTVKKDSIYITL